MNTLPASSGSSSSHSPAPAPTTPLWKNPWAQGAFLLGLLILYLIAPDSLRGILAPLIAIAIFAIVLMEIREGARSRGWKEEALDTLKALLFALVLWFGLGFVLQTSSPISAVASCSMLPNLDRGDFVIVQGGQPVSAYNLTMSSADFDALRGGTADVRYDGRAFQVKGSMGSFCQVSNDPVCQAFRKDPGAFSESRGPLQFHYTLCSIRQTGDRVPCVDSLRYQDRDYPVRTSNDILVYSPRPADVYALIGDIVHRTYVVVNVNGNVYYLTKGDNNPILDLQVYHYGFDRGNEPIAQDQAKGHVVLRVPWLGYFKLFISGLFANDPNCQRQLVYP